MYGKFGWEKLRKMRNKYDFIYLTNTPSFYKLNLCNEIAQKCSLLLVLYGYGSEAVNRELGKSSHYNFDYYFLNEGDSNSRNKWQTFWRLIKLMHKIQYRRLLFSGWMSPEYNMYAFISPKAKNVVVCESSIWDVSFKGLAGWIKKKIIQRMSAALPSGKPHAELFQSISFRGDLYITGSVGIFNKGKRVIKEHFHKPVRYIYVGRLINVKNVELLIEEFNSNGKPLTIVGSGILEQKLRQQAYSNITFLGFVSNEKLGVIYQAHDVFILPSYYEPWGLVVEEALYWGLPVIVSDKVGSSVDMVKNLRTGYIFQSGNLASLHEAIMNVERYYVEYRYNVLKINWKKREEQQINAYISLL